MRAGEYNEATIFIGPPGCGKSVALKAAAHAAAAAGCYVFASDPSGTFARGERGVQFHTDEHAACAALKVRPGGVHVVRVADGMRVARLAEDTAHAAARAAGGEHATTTTPAVFACDEVVLLKGVSPSSLDERFAQCYALRRHLPPTHTASMGFLLATQYPAQLHPQLWLLASRLVIFRVDADDALAALQKRAGVPRAVVERIPQLELLTAQDRCARVEGKHFITWRR